MLQDTGTDLGTAQTTRMFHFTLLALFCCSIGIIADHVPEDAESFSASSSPEFGGGGGSPFSHAELKTKGPITAIRVRADGLQITGLQVRYGNEWSAYKGGSAGTLKEVILERGETVTQVSGSADDYVRSLEFTTNYGRTLIFGNLKPFRAVPLFPGTILRFFSGRSGNFIDAIAFHWDIYPFPGAAEEVAAE